MEKERGWGKWGCIWKNKWDKGSAQDKDGVCVWRGEFGVGVNAVNLDVTDRKTGADHYHKSDKR